MEIEASQIKQGGGKILLFDLLYYLKHRNQRCTLWIGSKEIYNEILSIYGGFFNIKITSLSQTIRRYLEKRESVIFFCSVPPFCKCVKSVVYFQNRYYAWSFIQICSLIKQRRFRGFAQVLFFRLWNSLFYRNVAIWACQSPDVKKLLEVNLNINAKVLPFYNIKRPALNEKKYDFCYVAYPYPHKNHKLLLDSIDRVSKVLKFSFALTIPIIDANRHLLQRINDINRNNDNACITNLGSVPRDVAMRIYAESRFLIFPSGLETLGLPLIEAYYCGAKVIASDMPYAHAAIGNLISFAPENKNEFDKVFYNALNGLYDNVEQQCLIPNKIDDLISIVQ